MTHAYSITKVVQFITHDSAMVKLIRIRNPWGDETEWKGAWSDGSKEWNKLSKAVKEKHGITFDHNGEFYMTIYDFVKNFEKGYICNLTHDSLGKSWRKKEFYGSWKGKSAGGCKNNKNTYANNPQFTITLKNSDHNGLCTLIVHLMQIGLGMLWF